jgi:hypothetical protein
MSGFIWLLLTALAFVWLACSVVVAIIGVAAHRNDPRVVIIDPHERPSSQLAWDRLRAAVLQAKVDLEHERTDFRSWERELGARRHRKVA